MISSNHFAALKIFEINFLRLSKIFMLESQVPRGFHRFRNSAHYRKMPLNLFFKSNKIMLCQYSKKISQVSGKSLTQASPIIENPQEDAGEEYKNEFEENEETEEMAGMEEIEENEPVIGNEELFTEIANEDPDMLKKLKLLEFEMAILKGEGWRVPEKLKKEDWLELLSKPSLKSRKEFLTFICTKELTNKSIVEKGKLLAQYKIKKKQEEGFHYYGLGGQTMFMRIYSKSVNRLLCLRQMTAEQTILFDCSYQSYMNAKNTKHCAKQIFMSLSNAVIHQYPCNIKFCNFNENDYLGKIFPKYVALVKETFGAEICKESYLDLFPREKLVYLSPHAQHELIKFNKDKIYIIGAYVDQGDGKKASLAKAKENNIKMAKLPLDYYLSWKLGNKSLPLNTVLNILLDMNYYNDWNKALRHIPTRFLYNSQSRRLWSISKKSDMNFV